MIADRWTAASIRPGQRYDAWRAALNASHLEWTLERSDDRPFRAAVTRRRFGAVDVVECACDPCTGRRNRPEIARTEGAYFGVLFELGGREVIRQDGREAVLEPGDFVMWDSEREMEFRVLSPLRKLTLLIPKPQLSGWLADPERHAGAVVRGGSGAGALASDVLRRLAREIDTIETGQAGAVMEPVLGLVSAALTAQVAPRPSTGSEEFRRICAYIEAALADPDLSPAGIARAHGMSIRTLYTTFADNGASVSRWIRLRRLHRCRQELARSGRQRTITEIAFDWGFNDMAHFSRAFKATYGVSPRAFARGRGDAGTD